MEAIELRARREALGLSQTRLAHELDTSQAAVSLWESAKRQIPASVAVALTRLEDGREEVATAALSALEKSPDRALTAFQTDEALWAAHPELRPLPAATHRVGLALAVKRSGLKQASLTTAAL